MRTDKYGNNLDFAKGYHVQYYVEEIENVSVRVSESLSSESVYVHYYNEDNGKRCTCRFSTHMCNNVEFGEYLDGNIASRDEILFRLGLKKRTFIPNIKEKLIINSEFINRHDRAKYTERCNLTIKDMYAMGEGADLSEYVGKVTSDGKWLILGDKVEKLTYEETRTNSFGLTERIGTYIYE